MKRLKLVNIASLGLDPLYDQFAPFHVDRYAFHSEQRTRRAPNLHTPRMAVRANRVHVQNAYVEFTHQQEDSIIFRGGLHGSPWRPQRRKFIEDLLVLGSLLTGRNWSLYSRRSHPIYPVIPVNHLRAISDFRTELPHDLTTIVGRISDPTWQTTFDNGFHLVALLNKANILNNEARFLSDVVLWELIYSKLFGREENNLHKVIGDVLEFYWPGRVNRTVFTNGKVGRISPNIIYVLRNQLAHSGRLPIDRPYAENWMTTVPVENPPLRHDTTLGDYTNFFGDLTQVVVLKTLDFHAERRAGMLAFGFANRLDTFLATGRI